MERIIIFLYSRNVDICEERIMILNYFNPNISIHGLYLGIDDNYSEFETRLSKYFTSNYHIKGKTNEWIKNNRDFILKEWYNKIGRNFKFDCLHLIEWDFLLFNSLENIYNNVKKNEIGVILYERLSSIEDKLLITNTQPFKNHWNQLLKFARHNCNFNNNPNISINYGLCLPKSFLEQFSKINIPELSTDELRIPLLAQILDYNLKEISEKNKLGYIKFKTKYLIYNKTNFYIKNEKKEYFHIYRKSLFLIDLFKIIREIQKKERVKIYKTEKTIYIFDSESFDILICDEFTHIIELLLNSKTTNEIFKTLLNYNQEIISKIYYFFSPIIENNKINLIEESSLIPTYEIKLNPDSNCNLSCSYCFKDTKLFPRAIDSRIELMKTAIEKVISGFGKDLREQCVTFRITSEPFVDLINMEILIDLVKKLEVKFNKTIVFHFCTNGTILNEKILKIIRKARGENGLVHISLDGPQEVHDLNRMYKNGKGTYEIIKKNIETLKNHGHEIAISSVITNKYPFPKKILQHLISLGIDQVLMKPCRSFDGFSFNNKNINILIKGYNEYFNIIREWIFEKNERLIKIIRNDYALRYIKIFLAGKKVTRRCSWSTWSLSMDGNGDLFPCDSFIGIKEFKIGNINTGINNKLNHTSVHVAKRKGCNKCWAKYVCGGTCYYTSYLSQENILENCEIECKLNKFLIEKSFELICDIMEINMNDDFLYKILEIKK